MLKKFLLTALAVAIVGVFGNPSDASLVLLIDDHSTSGFDVIVIDNQPAGSTSSGGSWTSTIADSNMTLGGVVFNGAVPNFEINVSTGVSKPLVHNNQIDLNSVVASFASNGGALTMIVLDTDFVDNGHGFRTQIGGTTNGEVLAESWVSANNGDSAADFTGVGPVSASPWFTETPFSWSEDGNATHNTVFGMAASAYVHHENAGMTSFDLNFQQIPEPTTVLIWSMLAGVGLVVRRRR